MKTRYLLPLVTLASLITAVAPAADSVPRIFVRDTVVQGEDEMKMRSPVGVASAHPGELVVIDVHDSRAIAFRFENEAWAGRVEAGLPGAPVAIAHDGKRYMVAMRGGHGLAALEGDDLQRRSVPLPGGAVPTLLAARSGGGVLVYDALGHQVIAVDTSGTPGERTPVESGATALAELPSGGFLVGYAGTSEVLLYDAQGALSDRIVVPGVDPVPAWPVWVRATAGGDVAILDRHGGRIAIVDRSGRLMGVAARPGWEPGLIRFPSSATVMKDGRMAITDTGNGRVQVFRRVAEDGS